MMGQRTRRPHVALLAMLGAALACVLASPLPALAKGTTADLADGEYLMDVTLEGGTGRASITSPTSVTVSDGEATATIEWSSPNYDYMVVDGKRYLPTNEGGNSTFEIPVLAFDEPFEVVGDTTAMSVPHEVSYTLAFDSRTAQRSGVSLPTLPLVLVLLVLVAVVALVVRRREVSPLPWQ